MDPANEVLACRDRFAPPELRQRRVEVLVVQPLDHPLANEAVEPAKIDDEAGHRVDLSLNADPQAVVVSVPRQIGALAEPPPVLLFAPIGTAVQVAGAETVAALQDDLHASFPQFGGRVPSPI